MEFLSVPVAHPRGKSLFTLTMIKLIIYTKPKQENNVTMVLTIN